MTRDGPSKAAERSQNGRGSRISPRRFAFEPLRQTVIEPGPYRLSRVHSDGAVIKPLERWAFLSSSRLMLLLHSPRGLEDRVLPT